MMGLTGRIFFSLFFLLPLRVEGVTSNVKEKLCPPGSRICNGSCCIADDAACPQECPPNNILTLQKKEDTIYSIEEGAIFKCEGNKTLKTLTSNKNGITYTCASE